MNDEVKKRTPFFLTPLGYVVIAMLLWVIGCVLAAVALLTLHYASFEDEALEILLTYLAFAPSTLMVIFSVAYLIVGSVRWALFGRAAPPSTRLNLHREHQLLESINQRLLLSETAKKISYRMEDMTVLRQTIRDDMRRGEFDAAMVLVTELANSYGQLEEAERFREEIDAARLKDQAAKIKSGIRTLEEKLSAHDFAGAAREAARLGRLYPESEAVKDLQDRVTAAREQYKQELERAFLHASEREEVDRALDIMQVLDTMLSPEEAEPFREVARGVIGKKRDNLGVQFKLAVHDKEWAAAVAAGEQIIKQFPNTRMADEVRERIDQLRANAAGQRKASARIAEEPITRISSPDSGITYTSSE